MKSIHVLKVILLSAFFVYFCTPINAQGIGFASLTTSTNHPNPGTTVNYTINGVGGTAFALIAAEPGRTFLPQIGQFDLDLTGFTAIVSMGVIPVSGSGNNSFMIPNDPVLGGVDIVLQAITWIDPASPSGNGFSISNTVDIHIAQSSGLIASTSGFCPVLPIGEVVDELVFADFNNDGFVDVYAPSKLPGSFFNFSPTQNHLMFNDGTGNLIDVTTTNLPAFTEISNKAIAVDVDMDGDIDIITLNGRNSFFANPPIIMSPNIYKNDGAGVFTLAGSITIPTLLEPVKILALDADNDGDKDLIIHIENISGLPSQSIFLFINDGFGNFSNSNLGTSASVPTTTFPILNDIKIADVNNDGMDDIILLATPVPEVWFNNNNGTFLKLVNTFFPFSTLVFQQAEVADFDADGDVDIIAIVINAVNGKNLTLQFRNNGGIFSPDPNPIPSFFLPFLGPENYMSIGDIDNDGDLDIATNLSWKLNDGAGNFTESNTQSSSGGSPIKLFDLNGDNNLDTISPSGHPTIMLLPANFMP